MRSNRGEGTERQVVASFGRYIEAEVFIHAELLRYSTRGTEAGAVWGSDDDGGHVRFWIQSPRMTGSTRLSPAWAGPHCAANDHRERRASGRGAAAVP